ncbi:TaqI-like C-terminal specificity domain-containing protein [Clostridium sp. OS1-26]|uniref:TaqI-like C-terminal specificity domain-containing protein n=1 Tax=Clostridium sp. OS1-26 TaxID=3070681 RepID=UPI0027DF833D|nr:TaqI-like C-terminal specificity domain-containing protein [Clostridium sp. OS1-26]WML35585.1 TaqI-like C-terminal specificity domain-containing protein [Clostridium sp. OS1-26]
MDGKHDNTVVMGEEYEKHLDLKIRKDYGRFYTPEFIVTYIIENTMNNIDIIENPFIKILDPSCGSGYFLIKVYDILMDKFSKNLPMLNKKYYYDEFVMYTDNGALKIKGKDYWYSKNIHYHIIKNCIFGSDIDINAVELAKINLSSKSKGSTCVEPNVICCDSLIKWEEDYNLESITEINNEVFLCEYTDIEGNLKKKELNCNEVKELTNRCEFWSNKYDYIIGNPPWVSLSRKHKGDIEDKLISYYIDKYKGNFYLPNLYEYFIKRSFQMIKDEGAIGFIIPDRFAKNLQYKLLRKNILNNYNILNLTFEIKFPNINTDTMVFVAKKNYSEDNKIRINVFNKRSYYVNQKEYLKSVNYELSYEDGNNYRAIKNKIEKESESLGEIGSTFTGFIGDSKKITKERVSDSQVEILKGENIARYNILKAYYYEFVPENIKGGTKDLSKLSSAAKIIIRKTGNKIIAALDTKGYIVEQSLYGLMKLDNKYLYKYILAVLNSKLAGWYYLNFLVTNLNSTPQIKKYNLDKMPIKKCSIDKQKDIEKIVNNLIDAIKHNDTEHINKIEEKLNTEIFNLYNINSYERKIINKI